MIRMTTRVPSVIGQRGAYIEDVVLKKKKILQNLIFCGNFDVTT